jgi:phosphatidylserine decarboxylase
MSLSDMSKLIRRLQPQAIRTALDVYGENARKIVPIDSPQFGRVMAVCIGAMMVGSIKTTVEEGATVKRGQEFGYFAFGKCYFCRAYMCIIFQYRALCRWLDYCYPFREERCRVGRRPSR